jgi:hypothetical protein
LSRRSIWKLKSLSIITRVVLKSLQSILGEDYVFADYIFSIEKSSVSTCHRDENGSVLNPKMQYILIYDHLLFGGDEGVSRCDS